MIIRPYTCPTKKGKPQRLSFFYIKRQQKLLSKGDGHLIETADGLAHVLTGFPFRHGHDTADSLFVAFREQRNLDLGVTDAAIFLDDELNQHGAGDTVVTGDFRILDFAGQEGVESFGTAGEFRHLFREHHRRLVFGSLFHNGDFLIGNIHNLLILIKFNIKRQISVRRKSSPKKAIAEKRAIIMGITATKTR